MKIIQLKMERIVMLAIVSVTLIGCQSDSSDEVRTTLDWKLNDVLSTYSPTGKADYFKLPESNDFSKIPSDPNNPLTAEKVELGRLLFHETGLAVHAKDGTHMETFSCASCHHAQAGFQAGVVQGIGDGGLGFGAAGEGRMMDPIYVEDSVDVQPIRTPSAMNSAYQMVMLWNGQFGGTGPNVGTEAQWTPGTPKETNELGFEGIETQAIAGLKVHRMEIDEELMQSLGYFTKFNDVFSDRPEAERCTKETAGLAIAAYERTLLANRAPFQLWLRGYTQAMSEQEKIGAIHFFETAQCGNCHTGPALNSMAFHGYGMLDLSDNDLSIINRNDNASENRGRGGFTGNPVDNYKFKVPQLYNLLSSPHYGHGGNFHSLSEVVDYKNQGVKENMEVPDGQLAPDFQPLGLTENQVEAITAFLTTGLYDAELQRYTPVSIPSGNCFPNNDTASRQDLGCE